MFTRLNATMRDGVFAAPFAAFALATIGYGAYRLVDSAPHSWTHVLAVMASVIICGPFQVHIGRRPGFPFLGVAITMLAITPLEQTPMLGVCIWATGYAIFRTIAHRNLLHALYETGLCSAGAFAFVAIRTALTAQGAWLLPSLIVASAAYYLVVLLVELARQRIRPAGERGFGLAEISFARVGFVVAMVAVTAALMNLVNVAVVPWLEHDPSARRAALITLLTALVFYVLAQLRRYADTERRLRAIVEAAIELPRETDGGLISALRRRARCIVRASEVELRSGPPERGEIGAVVSLESDDHQYLIASRKAGGASFTREDERALSTLAHMANEAARIRYEVDALELRANSDPLTGLPNYGAFQRALAEANEHRSYHEGIALLFIDLDNFKRFNDGFGHRAGDELLRAVAARLQRAAGGGDFVSRVGGDEFVVILTGLVSLEQAKESADRIVERVSQPLTLEGHDMRPVVSAGLAFSGHREIDARSLVEDADRTMLQAKRSRQHRGGAAVSSVQISSHRSTRTNDIVARAIRENRLSLAFQPIVRIDEGRIWAFEALTRYIDPELGPISAPSLIARAKSLGLLNELTKQIITKALDAAEEFRRLEPAIDCMTVNLELGQISATELGSFIHGAARAHPDISLCIELNERSLRSVTDSLRCDAERMQEAGVIIALDDYGSDDSSVGALVHFPLNIVKIDKSLIDDLDDVRQREVIKALQGFADNLSYTMVVEGIEHPATAEVLTELGVRSAQGYYFGRPLSHALTLDRLRRWGARAVIS